MNVTLIISRGGLESGSLLGCHTTSADVCFLYFRSFGWEREEYMFVIMLLKRMMIKSCESGHHPNSLSIRAQHRIPHDLVL